MDGPGVGFKLTRLSPPAGPDEPTDYHVLLHGTRSECECRGFLRHSHCKHVCGLLALQAEGSLPPAPLPEWLPDVEGAEGL